jgi:RNA polymerase sigma factor (sigma-70 family)
LDNESYLDAPLSNEQDTQLLRQLYVGSRDAFTTLYNHYQPRLYLYLEPFTHNDKPWIEEIVQEVFIKVWIKRKELTHIKVFEYYLQRMAKNLLLDNVRLRQIKVKHETLSAEGQKDWTEETENEYHFKEYYKLTREALALLPERRRYLFQLSNIDGYSLDEISALTHLSKAVVKKQLALANRFLRSHLQQKGGFPIHAGMLLVAGLLSEIK